MKGLMATAAALALFAGVTAANAQNAPATNNPSGTTMQQPSSSKPTVRGTSHKHAAKTHKTRHQASMRPRYTTGAAPRSSAGQNDPSIHQSKQRDSRGTPKGTGPDQFK